MLSTEFDQGKDIENRQFGVCLPTLVKPSISFSNYCTFFVLMEVRKIRRRRYSPLIAGYHRFRPSVTNHTAQAFSFKLLRVWSCRWLYMKVYWWLLTAGGSGTTRKSESEASTRPIRLSPSIAHSICTGPIIALGNS